MDQRGFQLLCGGTEETRREHDDVCSATIRRVRLFTPGRFDEQDFVGQLEREWGELFLRSSGSTLQSGRIALRAGQHFTGHELQKLSARNLLGLRSRGAIKLAQSTNEIVFGGKSATRRLAGAQDKNRVGGYRELGRHNRGPREQNNENKTRDEFDPWELPRKRINYSSEVG